ncbi:MAG: mevalonate kinase [Ignisphaera sp.]|nr:mevalonate kinase [Ignisphaera sp.]
MYLIKVPLKVTLFGEYAVVFGKPAIASTLPTHIIMKINKYKDKDLIHVNLSSISIPLLSVSIDKESLKPARVLVSEPEVERLLQYIVKAIHLCENELKPGTLLGFDIEIQSPVPPGVGLGTSAAVSVGSVAACLATYIGDKYVDKNLIAKIAWKTEQIVQGAASPMDTYTITFGGLRYIEPSIPKAEPLSVPQKLPLLIGYTLKRFTTAELIGYVKKKLSMLPTVVNKVIDAIGTIVEKARQSILSGDIQSLGMLMNINHGLLDSLGVVSSDHHIIVNALRSIGALGAKTSGAGGGGAFIALAKDEAELSVLSKVLEALGARIVAFELGSSGIEVSQI